MTDEYRNYGEVAQRLCEQATTAMELAKRLQASGDWFLNGWRKSLKTIIEELEKGDLERALIVAQVEQSDLERRLEKAAATLIKNDIGWEDNNGETH